MSLLRLLDQEGFYKTITRSVPKLERGICWCHTCGNEVKVNAAQCLRSGFPICCGQTMSIDSPADLRSAERRALR